MSFGYNVFKNYQVRLSQWKVNDKLRFFHGDGPAQQIEAGSKLGGNYPCVGCTSHSCMFSDLAHTFRSDTLTLSERQKFVTAGKAWKKGGIKPLDKLSAKELTNELQAHGVLVDNMDKKQLEAKFEEIRAGINNVPALLQSKPSTSPQVLNLQQYEILPVEPLHDLKGHFSNLIDETVALTQGNVKTEVLKVKDTALS